MGAIAAALPNPLQSLVRSPFRTVRPSHPLGSSCLPAVPHCYQSVHCTIHILVSRSSISSLTGPSSLTRSIIAAFYASSTEAKHNRPSLRTTRTDCYAISVFGLVSFYSFEVSIGCHYHVPYLSEAADVFNSRPRRSLSSVFAFPVAH